MSAQYNSVSIMMVTFNRLELTKRMLDSLLSNTTGNFRLIIVDNGSTDGTVEYLKELKESYPISIHTHFYDKNMGIAIGRNKGLEIADQFKDEYLATVDNDIEFYKGWLNECIDIIEVNPKLAIGLNMEGVDYPLIKKNNKTFQYKSAGNLGTACAVFHRQLHELIGFFNMEFGLYGEEDADFFFRARRVGWEMGYLKTNGIHFGVNELDTGEYREFKTKCHRDNLVKFQQFCRMYVNKQKSCFISFDDINKTQ